MTQIHRAPSGSRFLYEPFDYAPQVREANEKLRKLQFQGIEARFDRIEILMERLERRLWLTVYGVVATILAQAVGSLMTLTPIGGS